MRSGFYIDGFNVYGAIQDFIVSEHRNRRTPPHHLKWLDYRSLCTWIASLPQARTRIPQSTVEFVRFYSAITNNPNKRDRHEAYVAALKATGVEVHLGNFKRKERRCRDCGATCENWEEKETDVHIGVDIVADAIRERIDIAYVLSQDSDLGPAFRVAKEESGVTIVTVAFQPRSHSFELVNCSDEKFYVNMTSVAKNLLPERVKDPSSLSVAVRPSKYRPPE